jgi:hypothetical protein
MAETADGFDHIVVGGVRGRSAAQAARAQLAVQLRQHLVAHHRPRLVEAGDIRRGAAPGPPAHPQRTKHVDIVEIHDAAFGAKDQRPAPAPGFLEREGCEGASLGVGLRSGFWLGHFGSHRIPACIAVSPGPLRRATFPMGRRDASRHRKREPAGVLHRSREPFWLRGLTTARVPLMYRAPIRLRPPGDGRTRGGGAPVGRLALQRTGAIPAPRAAILSHPLPRSTGRGRAGAKPARARPPGLGSACDSRS